MRLRGITTVEQANQFLREQYVGEFNRRFALPAAQRGTAFLPRVGRDLERIFAIQYERVVNGDNTVQVENRHLQIEQTPWRATLTGYRVMVYQHLDGTWSIAYGPHQVGHYSADGAPLAQTGTAEALRSAPPLFPRAGDAGLSGPPNRNPKPFVWTADADLILGKVQRLVNAK